MLKLVTGQNLDQLEAWNQSSVQLIHAAKVFYFMLKLKIKDSHIFSV
jgi:hypothetical protein